MIPTARMVASTYHIFKDVVHKLRELLVLVINQWLWCANGFVHIFVGGNAKVFVRQS
jgi:hypothetical protein